MAEARVWTTEVWGSMKTASVGGIIASRNFTGA